MGLEGYSKRANVIFSDSENQDTKPKHFGFGFSTQNVSSSLKFYLTLIDDKGEQTEFKKKLTQGSSNKLWNSINSIMWIW